MGVLTNSSYMMTWDAASLAKLTTLATTAVPVFTGYYTSAMAYAVQQVVVEAMARAPVVSGTLRRGIQGHVIDAWTGEVGVLDSIPYAARREFGFDRQTDALGRYYPLDPADPDKRAHMHYLENGLAAARPRINAAYRAATAMALKTIAI